MMKLLVTSALLVCCAADFDEMIHTFSKLTLFEHCCGKEANWQYWSDISIAVKECFDEGREQWKNKHKEETQNPFSTIQTSEPETYSPYGSHSESVFGRQPYQQQQQSIFSRQKRQTVSSKVVEVAREIIDSTKKFMGHKYKKQQCVKQKLGWIDSAGDLNLQSFKQNRISKYQSPIEFKQLLLQNVDICAEKTGCTPNSLYSRFPWPKADVQREMFFKCYQKLAVQSCVMYGMQQRLSKAFGGHISVEDSIAMLAFKKKAMECI